MLLNVATLNKIVTYVFLLYVLLGPSPFLVQGVAENANVEGGQDLFRQFLLISIFCALFVGRKFDFDIRRYFAFVVFLAYAAISITWSDFPLHSFRRVMLLFVVFYICCAIVESQRDNIFSILFDVLIFIQTLNLIFMVGASEISFTDIGFKGVHIQKNTLGVVCVFSILISFIVYSKKNKFAVLYLGVMSAIFLLMSESKTNFVLIAFLLVPMVLCILSPLYAKKIIVCLIGLVVLLFFVAGFAPNFLISNYAELIDHETLTGRGTIWLVLLDNIEDKPYFGFGYGGFWGVGEKSVVFYSDASWLDKIGEGHNGFLDLLVNLGVVGLYIYLLILIYSIRTFSKNCFSTQDVMQLCLYLYLLLHNFTESSLVNVVQMVWVMFILISMNFIRKEQ